MKFLPVKKHMQLGGMDLYHCRLEFQQFQSIGYPLALTVSTKINRINAMTIIIHCQFSKIYISTFALVIRLVAGKINSCSP